MCCGKWPDIYIWVYMYGHHYEHVQYIHVYAYTNIYKLKFLEHRQKCAEADVCRYIYIYIYTHTHTYICTYKDIKKNAAADGCRADV